MSHIVDKYNGLKCANRLKCEIKDGDIIPVCGDGGF